MDIIEYGECYEGVYRSIGCVTVEDRMVASIELTKCDLLSTKLVIPMECEGAYTPSDCTHALSRSPQLWNSYTGYLRDSFSLCQLVKPSGLANRQSIIVQHMDILLDRLNVAINTQEALNHHQYTQFNDLFNAIYIHLNHTTDQAINTLVAALDDLIDGSLNGIIDTLFTNLFSSIRSVVNLSILYYLLRWTSENFDQNLQIKQTTQTTQPTQITQAALYQNTHHHLYTTQQKILLCSTLTTNKMLDDILSPSNPHNTPLLLISHSHQQSPFLLLRYIALQYLHQSTPFTILCYEQSPEFYKGVLGDSDYVGYIDMRYISAGLGTPTLPHTPLIIDNMALLPATRLREVIRRTPVKRVIAAIPHTHTHLLHTLTNASTTPTISTLTLHPLPHYHTTRTAYGLAPTHPSFYSVLHEQLLLAPLHPSQHHQSCFVVEGVVRSPRPKLPLVRRSLDVVAVQGAHGLHIKDVTEHDLEQVQVKDKQGSADGTQSTQSTQSSQSSQPPPPTHASFNLALTDAQKQARESVLPPYLQAQQEDAHVQTSNTHPPAPVISYDPDSADDWDDDDPDDDLDL
ncbi:hypothetical protein E3P98_00122 [Wallemia ichthyophaga]|nr:hypothetical protein E3P98_00122 [Wallemia ichthyophaga]